MKIGILGGTFNPVHMGHIILAEEAYKRLVLDKLIFVPSYIPPHKDNREIVPPDDRYRMVELAAGQRDGFEVSDIEIKMRGMSYSINTIKEFKRIYGADTQIYFIAGSDYAEELESWKDIDNLKRLCSFVLATRPGYRLKSKPPDTAIISVDTPDISSTDIRELIKEEKEFKKFLPEAVYNYIIKRRLYL